MGRYTVAVAAALGAAVLASCTQLSNPFSVNPIDEALAMIPAGEGITAISYVDFRGIRAATGVEVVAADTRLERDASEANRWGIGFLVTALNAPYGDPLLGSTNLDWVIHGAQTSVAKAPKEVVSDAEPKLTKRQGVRLDGDLILIESSEDMGKAGRQAKDKSLADLAEVKALRPCLDGAQVFSLVGAMLEQKYPFLTASKVDDQGRGQAWACVLAGADAESYAESIRQKEKPEVGAVSVAGDVVRVEMKLTDNGGPIPDSARYGSRAVTALSPGF